jgi:hypothetical protein
MRRFVLLLVLQGCGILAFGQLPATNPGPPQSFPHKPLFEMNGRESPQITPPAKFWIDSLSGLKSAQNQTIATGDVNQILHAPNMDASTVWTPLRPSPSILTSPLPIAKLEPIPTQWPNAKLEQIPTTWPNLKLKQASDSNSISAPSK